MRLNKTTSHAIRILIECARSDGKLVKAADLSNRLDITLQNVLKIVHILSHAGLVAGHRGRSGGVALARSADRIRIGDIVRAMEATEFEVDVDGAMSKEAGRSIKGVNRVLDHALEAFIEVLDRHTLADMAGQNSGAAILPKAGPKARKTSQPRTPRTRARARHPL